MKRPLRLLSLVLLSLLCIVATDVHATKRSITKDAVIATGHAHLESDPELGSVLTITGFYFSPVAKKINNSVEASRTESIQLKANTAPTANQQQVVSVKVHLLHNYPTHNFW